MSAVRPHGVVEVAAAGAAGMTTGVRVRLAERSDVEGIFAIYDREVLEGTATAATVCFTEAEREAWFERHPPDRHPLVVAVEGDGAVVAWAGLAPWSPRAAYDRTAENSVYVRRDRHRRGLGRLVLGELLAVTLRRTPIRVVIARPTDSNTASIALHAGLGYETVGVLRGVMEKFGRLHDVRIMSKRLD